MNLHELKKVIPYQWKVQTVYKTGPKGPKAQCVAYVDARDVMNLLDEVVGVDNWQDEYRLLGDTVICRIGIRTGKPLDGNNGWVWKEDAGTSGDFEKEKSAISDAFKRAAVKWGIGRFLYDLDMRWVPMLQMGDKHVPVDEKGARIYNLTDYMRRQEKYEAERNSAPTASKMFASQPPKPSASDTDLFTKDANVSVAPVIKSGDEILRAGENYETEIN